MSTQTEEMYQPIYDHGKAHRVAMENLTKAMAQGDHEAMQKYFDEAKYHEQMQREAGIEARKYFLGKVQG
jgi:hypothetical protein